MKKPRIQATIKNYQRKWSISRPAIHRFIQKIWIALHNIPRLPRPYAANPGFSVSGVLQESSTAPVELSIVIMNDNQIQSYNKQYRDKNAPTDVLSFPVNHMIDRSWYLGDVLISSEMTASQAIRNRHSFGTELRILLLHGILHLLGYDHEKDQGEMERLEKRLRRTLLQNSFDQKRAGNRAPI